jgi:hypothetical protein
MLDPPFLRKEGRAMSKQVFANGTDKPNFNLKALRTLQEPEPETKPSEKPNSWNESAYVAALTARGGRVDAEITDWLSSKIKERDQ